MRIFLPLVGLMMMAGCAPTPRLETVTAIDNAPYRIGAGDRLRITTYGEQSLTGEFPVDGQGQIQFALLGDISVAGRTLAEVRDDLTQRLSTQYLRSPRVSVDVAAYRPVYILGEIARPGEFPYAERMNVMALIAKAGGFTTWANRKFVYIKRESDSVERAYPLVPSLAVHPGDQLRVAQSPY